MFGFVTFLAGALPLVAPFTLYAPFSVVVLVWAPDGWPFASQFAKRAESNQLTNVIGRLAPDWPFTTPSGPITL